MAPIVILFNCHVVFDLFKGRYLLPAEAFFASFPFSVIIVWFIIVRCGMVGFLFWFGHTSHYVSFLYSSVDYTFWCLDYLWIIFSMNHLIRISWWSTLNSHGDIDFNFDNQSSTHRYNSKNRIENMCKLIHQWIIYTNFIF